MRERADLLGLVGRDLPERQPELRRLDVVQRAEISAERELRELRGEADDRPLRREGPARIREVDVAGRCRCLAGAGQQRGQPPVVRAVVGAGAGEETRRRGCELATRERASLKIGLQQLGADEQSKVRKVDARHGRGGGGGRAGEGQDGSARDSAPKQRGAAHMQYRGRRRHRPPTITNPYSAGESSCIGRAYVPAALSILPVPPRSRSITFGSWSRSEPVPSK